MRLISSVSLAILALFLFLSALRPSAAKGVVELDSVSGPRIIAHLGRDALVSFQENAWDAPNGFEDIAEAHNELVVAKVACRDNAGYCKIFAAEPSQTHKHVIRYIAAGGATTPYHGEISGESLVEFISVQRNPQLQELKQLGANFLSSKDQKGDAKKAAGILAGLVDEKASKYGKLFTSTMDRILSKGESFVQGEIARLEGLIGSGATKEDKKKEFKLRKSVLHQFLRSDDTVNAD